MKQRLLFAAVVLFLFFGAVCTFRLLNFIPENTIAFVYPNKVNYEPMIIATEKRYFADEGLDIKVRTVVGGIQAAEAIAAGSVDAAAMGDAPAIMLMSKHIQVKVIARYGGGDKIHRIVAFLPLTKSLLYHPNDVDREIGNEDGGGDDLMD